MPLCHKRLNECNKYIERILSKASMMETESQVNMQMDALSQVSYLDDERDVLITMKNALDSQEAELEMTKHDLNLANEEIARLK